MSNHSLIRSQKLIKEVIVEVRSYATLLSSIDNDSIDSRDLVGIGINLEKIHRKLTVAHRLLEPKMKKNPH